MSRNAPNREPAQDGRVQRGAENRRRILDALSELLREGELVPTAEQVARRAGVGTRTVFRHFDDMESLHAEMSERVQREISPLTARGAKGGSVEERMNAVVSQRFAIYERIGPFKRSADVQRWQSPFLQEAHADMVRRLRKDLLQALPELEGAPAALVDGVELFTSFEAWNRLRADQRLGRQRAEEAAISGVTALLRSAGL